MSWEEDLAALRDRMEAMHLAREDALKRCRLIIQASAKCIRHVHRRQFDQAAVLFEEAKTHAQETRRTLAPHPDLLYAGYLQDAEKEMVEAAAILAWVHPDATFPKRDALGVGEASFLNGLGEAASELRRYLLDELRQGHFEESERLLNRMETVYDDLITFDYPDALTGGLRRTCDALRAVVERTRSDVTLTRMQQELIAQLKQPR